MLPEVFVCVVEYETVPYFTVGGVELFHQKVTVPHEDNVGVAI